MQPCNPPKRLCLRQENRAFSRCANKLRPFACANSALPQTGEFRSRATKEGAGNQRAKFICSTARRTLAAQHWKICTACFIFCSLKAKQSLIELYQYFERKQFSEVDAHKQITPVNQQFFLSWVEISLMKVAIRLVTMIKMASQ